MTQAEAQETKKMTKKRIVTSEQARRWHVNSKHKWTQIRIPSDEMEDVRASAAKDKMPISRKIAEYITWGLEAEGRSSNV